MRRDVWVQQHCPYDDRSFKILSNNDSLVDFVYKQRTYETSTMLICFGFLCSWPGPSGDVGGGDFLRMRRHGYLDSAGP